MAKMLCVAGTWSVPQVPAMTTQIRFQHCPPSVAHIVNGKTLLPCWLPQHSTATKTVANGVTAYFWGGGRSHPPHILRV